MNNDYKCWNCDLPIDLNDYMTFKRIFIRTKKCPHCKQRFLISTPLIIEIPSFLVLAIILFAMSRIIFIISFPSGFIATQFELSRYLLICFFMGATLGSLRIFLIYKWLLKGDSKYKLSIKKKTSILDDVQDISDD